MPIEIVMPADSGSTTQGTLVKWLKNEGERIEAGEILAEVESDKAVFEVIAPARGQLHRILIPAGREGVSVSSILGLMLTEGEDVAAAPAAAEQPAAGMPASPPPSPEPPRGHRTGVAAPPAASAVPLPSVSGRRVPATPLARKLAREAGIGLAGLRGSGPGGRIVKVDVLRAVGVALPAIAPVAAAPTPPDAAHEPAFDVQPLGSMRRAIARRLSEAKQQIPHFYLNVDCEMDALLAMRKELNERLEGETRLSVTDMLIKAVAMALHRVPAANVSWSEAGIKLYKSIDIAMAVALQDGLVTPVIRAANQKGLSRISAEFKALTEKARAGKLRPEEYQGGTCSISNLGMYGIKQFEAIINPPQASILAVGASEQRAVVRNGVVAVATVMTCTLSADHRALDGTVAARFLTAFKKIVQDPLVMSL